MKNTTFFFLTLLLLCGIRASSQDSGLSFGLRGGVNLQTISGKDLVGDKLELNLVPRFNVGAVVGIPIAPEFMFQTGLMFTTKGAKSKSDFLGLDMAAEYNISYIEMPLNFLYRPVLGNGHLLLGFGPYVAYGFGGKAKFSVDNISSDEKIVYVNEYQSVNPFDMKYFRHMDYGGNLFFGYEMNSGLLIQLNTQLGLAKINAENTSYPADESEFRNTGYGISVGFNF